MSVPDEAKLRRLWFDRHVQSTLRGPLATLLGSHIPDAAALRSASKAGETAVSEFVWAAGILGGAEHFYIVTTLCREIGVDHGLEALLDVLDTPSDYMTRAFRVYLDAGFDPAAGTKRAVSTIECLALDAVADIIGESSDPRMWAQDLLRYASDYEQHGVDDYVKNSARQMRQWVSRATH